MKSGAWTLTVTFDSLATQERIQPEYAFPNDGCSRLIAHLLDVWGLVPEELPEVADWTDTTITVTSDTLDALAPLARWVAMHTLPKDIRLTRIRDL